MPRVLCWLRGYIAQRHCERQCPTRIRASLLLHRIRLGEAVEYAAPPSTLAVAIEGDATKAGACAVYDNTEDGVGTPTTCVSQASTTRSPSRCQIAFAIERLSLPNGLVEPRHATTCLAHPLPRTRKLARLVP